MTSWQLRVACEANVSFGGVFVVCMVCHGQDTAVVLTVEVCISQGCLTMQELAHKKAAELAAEARARKQALPPNDDRPLEDLLSFIGTEPAR